MINEANKQTKMFYSLLISKNTPGPKIVCIETDKDRRQTEAIKMHSNQLHSEQTSKKKDLIVKFEQFANNVQKNENSGDEVDAVMFEANEAPKPNDFRQTIYKETEPFLQTLIMNSKNVETRIRVSRLNEQIKEQNIEEILLNKDLEKFLIKIPTLITHFELAKDSQFNI